MGRQSLELTEIRKRLMDEQLFRYKLASWLLLVAAIVGALVLTLVVSGQLKIETWQRKWGRFGGTAQRQGNPVGLVRAAASSVGAPGGVWSRGERAAVAVRQARQTLAAVALSSVADGVRLARQGRL